MLFWKRLNWRLIRNFGYFYCASYAVGRHVGELVICSGPSMHPTIQDGDLVGTIPEQIINRLLNFPVPFIQGRGKQFAEFSTVSLSNC